MIKKIIKKCWTQSKTLFLCATANTHRAILTLILLILLTIYLVPSCSLFFGDIFFGRFQSLYNIKFAQTLYNNAANPVIKFIKPTQYAHHQLSRTYFIQGDLYRALKEAETEIALYPNSTTTYYIIGLIYGYMNQEDLAIASFTKYIETYPRSWAARNDKAWLQFRAGDVDGGLTTLEPILENNKYNILVQNTYCTLLINKKRFKEAKLVCNEAKKIISTMTTDMWGVAYPGNDPRIYKRGLEAVKASLDENINIINNKM